MGPTDYDPESKQQAATNAAGQPVDRHVSWRISVVFLKWTIWLVLLSTIVFESFILAFSPDQPLRAIGPLLQFLVCLATLFLIARRRITDALRLLVGATWIIVTVVLYFFGGVRGTLVTLYPPIVMLCGWLLGARSAVFLAILSVATTLVFVALDFAGLLHGIPATSAAMYGLIQIACIVFSAFLIVFLVRSYSGRLDDVETLSRELAQRTAEAQAIAADLNEAQSIAHIGSWVYDFARDSIETSAETCHIVGAPEGSRGTSQGYLKRVHPDDLEQLLRDWDEAKKGRPLFSEHRILMRGEIRWVRHRAQVTHDADGRPLRCIGTMQDITQLRLAEDELRIAATAFESREGMMVTDAGQTILRVNAAFTRITGYASDEVIGKTPRLLKSGHHDVAFYAEMWQRIANTGSWQGEIWNRRKNGELYAEWLTITAVKDAADKVTHYVGTLIDITQRKAAEEEIRNLAFYDPLTLLPNRRLLLDRLHQALASSARSGRQGALLFMDLDRFKLLNDTYGHDKGDLLLQQVALRLSTCIREGDTVARFGGDEFVIMLCDLSSNDNESRRQAETVATKILTTLGQPFELGDLVHHCTASIGVTQFANHQATPFELLKQADLAMYEAKTAGRNTMRFFSSGMRVALDQRSTENG